MLDVTTNILTLYLMLLLTWEQVDITKKCVKTKHEVLLVNAHGMRWVVDKQEDFEH